MVTAVPCFPLPHGMVRVLLGEQLYLAWSLTEQFPYLWVSRI
jgi:23S rRNA pseudoU1915 N3-methylase RlmH